MKRMRVLDLVIFLFSFIHSVLGFGKRLSDGDDGGDDWNEELFGDNQLVTVAVIIILVIILLAIIVFQITSFCWRKYRSRLKFLAI